MLMSIISLTARREMLQRTVQERQEPKEYRPCPQAAVQESGSVS